MNLKIILVILIFLPCISLAGDNKVDSLLQLAPKVNSDKEKVKLYIEIADAATNHEVKLYYAKMALHVSERINDVMGIGKSYFQIALFYEVHDIDSAIHFYTKSYHYFNKKEDLNSMAKALNCLGLLNKEKGNYEEAEENFTRSLSLVKGTNKELLGAIYNNLGILNTALGSYEKALQCYNLSLAHRKESNDQFGYAITMGNLGNLCFHQKTYNESLKYYEEAIKTFKNINNIQFEAHSLHNISLVNFNTGNFEQALKDLEEAINIYEKLGDRLNEAITLISIARIYSSLGEKEKSLENNLNALKILKDSNNKEYLVENYFGIGISYLHVGNYDESLEYLKKGLQLAKIIGHKQREAEAYEALHNYYEAIGDYRKALNYYQKYTILSDSLFNEEVSQRMANIMSNAEIEKREKEKALLQEQIARQELENKALAGGGIFLLLFALYFFFNTRQKKKANKLLTQQNAEINRKRRQIETISEQKTNLFVNLAHETKTPLTLIHNYLEEYIDKYGLTEETGVIRQNIEKLRKDITNFFDIEKYGKGFNVYRHDQSLDLSDYLKNHLVLFKKFAEKKQIQLSETIEDGIWIKADPAAISRIINNLVENAIKYTPEGGKVEVRLKAENKKIILQIQDTGIGISPALRKRIFEPYFQIHREKKNYQGMGLGLAIVKKIVDSLNGQIGIESIPDKGTSIAVTLPQQDLHTNGQTISQPNGHAVLASGSDQIKDIISNPNKPYLLLIEDNAAMLSFLCRKLKEKYNLYTAQNGSEAVEKLDTIQKLDLILCDVMMDVMDGFDFFETIKKRKQFDYVPFIFLTAKNTRESRDLGLKLGAIDYIEKPFRISELIQKIDAVLNLLDRQRFALVSQAYEMINGKSSGKVSHNFDLTKREKEIAALIASGKTYNQIAEELHISGKTVSKHVQNMFEKAKVSNKMELVNKLGAVK